MVGTIDKKDIQIVRSFKFTSSGSSQSPAQISKTDEVLIRTSVLIMKGIVFSVCYHSFDLATAKEIQLIIFNQLEDIEAVNGKDKLLSFVISSYNQFDEMLRTSIEKHFEENTSKDNIDSLRTAYGKHLQDLEGDPSVTKAVRVK